MSAPQATATGTLGGTPVANLLIYALDRRLSGTVVVEDPAGRRSAVSFALGAPAKVKLPELIAPLSEVLISQNVLEPAMAAELFAIAEREGRLFGPLVLERTPVELSLLNDGLVEQVGRKLEWIGTLKPESVYGYYDGQDFLRDFGPPEGAPVDPLAMIWRVLRAPGDQTIVDKTLLRLGSREVRLHPRSRVSRFGFDPRERGIVDVLRAKPQSIPSLVGTGILPEAQLKRVLYALVITRHLDIGADAPPVGIDLTSASSSLPPPAEKAASPVRPSARAASPAPSPQVSELRAEVMKRLESMSTQNHYEILGVDPKAPSHVIQAAFFLLAKRWHPDRLSPDLGDLRDVAVRIFARMTEAHQVLSNDDHRRDYERLMREGGATDDEQAEVQRVLRAAAAFQKAEVTARRGNLDEAEVHAQAAVENDPDQAEYVALYADILSQKPDRARSCMFTDVLKMVNEAKKKQPDNPRVLLYRARVLKRSGDLDNAYREYRAIVERDAHNVEAAREVRLHQMRRGKNTTDPRRTGAKGKAEEKSASKDIGAMFGKLFKR